MNLADGDLWSDPTREVGHPLFLRLVGHVIEPERRPPCAWSACRCLLIVGGSGLGR